MFRDPYQGIEVNAGGWALLAAAFVIGAGFGALIMLAAPA